jgi:hypothetical protein
MPVGKPVQLTIAWLTATAANKVNLGASLGKMRGRKIIDSHMPELLGENHSLAILPRPQVCFSARTIVPAGFPADAIIFASSLVEPMVL